MEALFGALNALAPWPRIVSICPMSRMNPGTIPARKLPGSREASVHVRPNHSCLLTFAAGGLIFLSILHLVAAAIQAVTRSSITWRLNLASIFITSWSPWTTWASRAYMPLLTPFPLLLLAYWWVPQLSSPTSVPFPHLCISPPYHIIASSS